MSFLKFKWKAIYYGFLAFLLGFVCFCLNKVSFVFVFIGLVLFLAGGVFNLVLAIKKFIREKRELKIIMQRTMINSLEKIEQELDEAESENQNGQEQKTPSIDMNQLVPKKLVRDVKFYKMELLTSVGIYSGIALLSIILFVSLLVFM